MNGKEFLAAEHINGTNVTAEQVREARATVVGYTRRQGLSEVDRLALKWDVYDELGLNGRPMRTHIHGKTNGKTNGKKKATT